MSERDYAPIRLVSCRRASDALVPGAATGFYCELCSREVQVSPDGIAKAREGAHIVCNPCGFDLAEELRHQGRLAGVTLNPTAVAQVAESERKQRTEYQCDICSAKVERYWLWKFRPFGTVDHMFVGRPVETEGGAWAICADCRPLWEGRDARALGARAEIMLAGKPGLGRELARLYEVVFLTLESGPTVVEVVRGR